MIRVSLVGHEKDSMIRRYAEMIGSKKRSLFKGLAHVGKEQTIRRIRTDKSEPDGGSWAPWSAQYAKTRVPGKHSLLMNTHDLVNTFKTVYRENGAEMGTNKPYAVAVQGKRAFMGISESNLEEMKRIVFSWIEEESGIKHV